MGIRRFSDNFPKIYAKTRFSELHERTSKAAFTQTKQTKYSLHGRSEHREWARQAQSSKNQANQASSFASLAQSSRAKRSLSKSSMFRATDDFLKFANQACFVRAKRASPA